MSALVGIAEHYTQFVRLCRQRIEELGITYETVDGLCGFPDRYTATLLCERKTMSVYSFFTVARALALLPEFHHDDAQLATLRNSEHWTAVRRGGSRFRSKRGGGAVRFNNHVDFYRQIGRKGAIVANAKSIFNKERARKAAQARWGRS